MPHQHEDVTATMCSDLGLEHMFLAGAYTGERQIAPGNRLDVVLRDAQRCIAEDDSKQEKVRVWYRQTSTAWARALEVEEEEEEEEYDERDQRAEREAMEAMAGTTDQLATSFAYWVVRNEMRATSLIDTSDPTVQNSEFIIRLPFPQRNNPLVLQREINGAGACELSVLDKYRNEWVPIETGDTPFDGLVDAAHQVWTKYCIYHVIN
ncbi:hypothetical protein [Medusavirus stheno T3]|uniref:Uncharacterized protein n=1 Tax=Medusavirus stheno T3 TaxID=3069717 RepID=A0A7S8BD25_9VIRU|nr:hypothetical protein QKU73_gp381 [Acanthamoeba castellanii medusavirus]QPB44394.1 hypothetical protein [Medusavirus stheno T3]